MKITQLPDGRWRLRYYVAGHGSPKRQRTFTHRKDAERFGTEIERRKQMSELVLFDQANRRVEELAKEWWRRHVVPNLAEWTRRGYKPLLANHIQPRLGFYKLREITPEVIADFRADLEAAGVGRHAVRVSMVMLQSMFKHAIRWRWVPGPNPVQQVEKPSGRRERAIGCLAPVQVEAIRTYLLEQDKLYAATMVSVIAYQGLRAPEELLAVEVRHVRERTLLVEQRNIDGEIVAGQKVRGFHPRAIDLLEPVKRDISEYLLATGIRSGLLFPRADGKPWRSHDWKNWTRRVWHVAREGAGIESLPPYDLRHAFASLQVRAGLSIPELAEQMGHSPAMTLNTYAHVIRELKGEPVVSAEEQVERARRELSGRFGDVEAAGADGA
jgi:integrase